MSILGDFYCADVLAPGFSYSESGIYRQLPSGTDHAVSYWISALQVFEVYNVGLVIVWNVFHVTFSFYLFFETNKNKTRIQVNDDYWNALIS